MPFRDLREFISLLDRQGKLLKVATEVEPAYELACLLMELIPPRENEAG